MSRRIAARFAKLKAENRAAFIPFITGGDPDFATSEEILLGLPGAGADLIEVGMPFSDPMAEGKPIQASSLRALQNGQTMVKTFALVRSLRAKDQDTPVILMGYANPVFAYGIEAFARDAAEAGADGLIIVDLPPEEDEELRLAAKAKGLAIIRLATPTSDDHRLKTIVDGADGFVYYVSVTGVTGGQSVVTAAAAAKVAQIRQHTSLPVAVGFGIKTAADAAQIAQVADAAVVGSSVVNAVGEFMNPNGSTRHGCAAHVLTFCRTLADSVRRARQN
jgi:tryptophan synthase alpha chain